MRSSSGSSGSCRASLVWGSRSPSPSSVRSGTRSRSCSPVCPVHGWAAYCTASLSINSEESMQKIVPFLWFDGKAEEAMNFYVSIFKNSKALSVTRYGAAGPGPKGTVMSATFQLEGQQFRSEEHTSELQSQFHLVCRLLLEKKKKKSEQMQ